MSHAFSATHILCVDAGNSKIALSLFRGIESLHAVLIPTRPAPDSTQLAGAARTLLAAAGLAEEQVLGVSIACVVKPLAPILRKAFMRRGRGILFVTHLTDTGLRIRYERPQMLGSDRITDAAEAFATIKKGVIAVNMGTATTFNVVNPAGEFLGGAIAPGAGAASEALKLKAPALPPAPLKASPRAVGRSTAECLSSGVMLGYAGLVDGLIQRMKSEMKFRPVVIATGGAAPAFGPLCRNIDFLDPLLTLRGLARIFLRQLTFSTLRKIITY